MPARVSYTRLFDTVTIVLVGKYVSLKDSYMSVIKSLEHAALRVGRKLKLEVSSVGVIQGVPKLIETPPARSGSTPSISRRSVRSPRQRSITRPGTFSARRTECLSPVASEREGPKA